MNTAERIAKNASLLLIANFVTLLLSFISLSLTGRYLGAEFFGMISLALAFSGMFGFISDLGLGTLTTREVARDKSLVRKYVGNTAVMRALLAVFTFALIVAIAVLVGYTVQTIYVVSIVALSLVFTSLTAMYNSVFQAFEKMKYQSLGIILNSALFLCGVTIVIRLTLGVISFAFIYLFVGAMVLIYTWIVFQWKFGTQKLEIDPVFWRSTIKTALPFALTSFFVTIFFWIDSVLLSVIKGVEVVGWYSAAYRLMAVLLIVPQVISLAVLPAMSRFFVEAKDSLLLVRDTFFRYMAILGVPIGIGVTFLADKLIPFIFGSGFTNSIIALQILVWASVLIFLESPLIRFLESANRQLSITKVALICTIANVGLNLILIPPFGIVAASYVTVATEGISLFLLLYLNQAVTMRSFRPRMPAVGKIAVAGALMAITIFVFRTFNHLVVTVAATCVYVLAVYVMGLVRNTDVKLLVQVLRPSK
jgi:O-antigen/teichoic acid export membrane protein